MSSKQLHYLKDLIIFCDEHKIKTGISLEEAKLKVDDDVLLSRHIAHCWNYIHMNRLDGEFRKQNPSETYFVGLRNKPYSVRPVPFTRKKAVRSNG